MHNNMETLGLLKVLGDILYGLEIMEDQMHNHQHPEMEAGVIGCLHRLMTLRIWSTSPKNMRVFQSCLSLFRRQVLHVVCVTQNWSKSIVYFT